MGIKTLEDLYVDYCNSHPPCNPQDKAIAAVKRVRSHELTHQFGINSCIPNGHDNNNAWCGEVGGSCVSTDPVCNSVQWCAMHNLMMTGTRPSDTSLCQMSTGIIRLDCSDLSSNSDCPTDCSDDRSVLTNTDPE